MFARGLLTGTLNKVMDAEVENTTSVTVTGSQHENTILESTTRQRQGGGTARRLKRHRCDRHHASVSQREAQKDTQQGR